MRSKETKRANRIKFRFIYLFILQNETNINYIKHICYADNTKKVLRKEKYQKINLRNAFFIDNAHIESYTIIYAIISGRKWMRKGKKEPVIREGISKETNESKLGQSSSVVESLFKNESNKAWRRRSASRSKLNVSRKEK